MERGGKTGHETVFTNLTDRSELSDSRWIPFSFHTSPRQVVFTKLSYSCLCLVITLLVLVNTATELSSAELIKKEKNLHGPLQSKLKGESHKNSFTVSQKILHFPSKGK
jgi:hypothetical protein